MMEIETFMNLKPGMFILYKIPNGLTLKKGRTVQDWKEKRSKIVMAFEHHVVVNGGGRDGLPYVVDQGNIL